MTKRDIVVQIASEFGKKKSGRRNLIKQEMVLTVVQRTLDIILEAVSSGETVELRNFGVFEVKRRKARVGRNPNSPLADVPIPPRAVVKFKPGKVMREQVLLIPPESLK